LLSPCSRQNYSSTSINVNTAWGLVRDIVIEGSNKGTSPKVIKYTTERIYNPILCGGIKNKAGD